MALAVRWLFVIMDSGCLVASNGVVSDTPDPLAARTLFDNRAYVKRLVGVGRSRHCLVDPLETRIITPCGAQTWDA